MNKTQKSEAQKLDALHHMHPFTHGATLKKIGAHIITHAKGAFIYDNQGNEIIDAMAGLWCVNIGYGRKEMADIAAQQIKELSYYNTFFNTSHPPVIALSKKIAEITPGDLNHVFYSSSGSEANDTNVRMARHYWHSKGMPDKQIIISRKNAYHGSTMAGASLSGMSAMHAQGGLPIPNITHINQPHWYSEAKNETPEAFGLQRAQELEKTISDLGEDRIAAFIAEPIQGAGGVIIPPDSYWPEISRICDKYNILLIVDEVITGFGRTGEWFGSNTFNLKADIMTIAKGFSSGYAPISASVVSDEVEETISKYEFFHGYTYSAHPLACALALENIRILEQEKIIENVKETLAPYLSKKWQELAQHPLVGEAVSKGLIGAIQLTPNKTSRLPFNAEPGTAGLICRNFCFNNNLIMRHVNDRMVISPPLIVTKKHIDLIITLATKSLDETYSVLKQKSLID